MRISDWSSDVCSSDLRLPHAVLELDVVDLGVALDLELGPHLGLGHAVLGECVAGRKHQRDPEQRCMFHGVDSCGGAGSLRCREGTADERSEEHTSELQSLMRISYAVFCLKKNR